MAARLLIAYGGIQVDIRTRALFLLVALLPLLNGCVSIQLPRSDGTPYVIGVGSSKIVPDSRGSVHRVVVPGLSIRALPGVGGFSFGRHEALYFFSKPERSDEHKRLLAFHLKAYGLDVSPYYFTIGYQRLFGVPFPPADHSSIQYVQLPADGPPFAEETEVP